MLRYEIGALNSLVNAKQALVRAEGAYNECRWVGNPINTDDGYGFEVLDNLDTAIKEIEAFKTRIKIN